MKRLIALALLLTFVLAACAPAVPVEEDPADTPADTVVTPEHTDSVALKIGNIEISGNEFRYYYYSAAQEIISNYGMYLGIDMDTPFDEQFYDEESGITWASFFEDQAVSQLQQIILLSEQAKKEGIELSSVFTSEVENQINAIKQYCTDSGIDMKTALAEYYGGSMDEDELRSIMQRTFLAYQYNTHKRGTFDISDSVLEAYYNENTDDYDEVDFLDYTFYPDYAEDGYTVVDNTKAKESADAFIAEVTDQTSFTDYVKQLPDAEDYDAVVLGGINEGGMVSAWLYDAVRAEGDKAIIESEDGAFHVLYFLRRYLPDNTALSIRHILISSENSTAEQARKDAEDIYSKWQSGDKTEASFSDMALTYSQDPGSASNGGLYDDVQPGQMVPTFNDWCFDTSRKQGDTGLVDTDFGTHIMYYTGYMSAWKNRVKLAIIENKFYDFYNGLITQYEPERLNLDVKK